MRISVVIPAFNEEKLLGRTLGSVQQALVAFSSRDWDTEVVVCDNNSTDTTSTIARAAGAQVVFEPVNQISRARNRGAEAATGDWFIFVDADSAPTRGLFDDVADAIASGHYLAGGSTVALDTAHPAGERITRFWNWISRTFCLLAGSFIFCEARAFHEVGGFSAELFAGEELDLSHKLKRLAKARGKTVVILRQHPLVTSARKVHLYSRTEYARFLLKASFARHRVLRSREACHPWYDGRR